MLPNLDRITKWVEAGATAKEVAGKLKISYSTFRKYLDDGEKGDERYTALSAAFAQACEIPDDQVEAALFKRACGFAYFESTYERVLNKATGEYEEVCTRRVSKTVPPDPTSATFWLANRRPDRWAYKPAGKAERNEDSSGVVLMPEVKADG